jgi:hypothetical protein
MVAVPILVGEFYHHIHIVSMLNLLLALVSVANSFEKVLRICANPFSFIQVLSLFVFEKGLGYLFLDLVVCDLI